MRLSPESHSKKPRPFPDPWPRRTERKKASSLRFFRGRWSMSLATEGSAGTWEILPSPRINGGVRSGVQVLLPGVPLHNNTLALRWRVGNRMGAKR